MVAEQVRRDRDLLLPVAHARLVGRQLLQHRPADPVGDHVQGATAVGRVRDAAACSRTWTYVLISGCRQSATFQP